MTALIKQIRFALFVTISATTIGCNPSGGIAKPEILSVSPGWVANENNPQINGEADPGTTVTLYGTSDCTGSALAVVMADDQGVFSAVVDVADNSQTVFSATSSFNEKVSSCAEAPETYVEDSVFPGQPTILMVTPSSPSSNRHPTLSGSTEAGSTVAIFVSGACEGSPSSSSQADEFGAFAVTSEVPADTLSLLSVRTSDAAGNESPCSSTVQYLHDGMAPSIPNDLMLTPAATANQNTPHLLGKTNAGAAIMAFSSNTCASPSALSSATADGNGDFDLAFSVQDDSVTHLYLKITDLAGNTSDCLDSGMTYTEDSTPPGPFSVTTLYQLKVTFPVTADLKVQFNDLPVGTTFNIRWSSCSEPLIGANQVWQGVPKLFFADSIHVGDDVGVVVYDAVGNSRCQLTPPSEP